MDKKYYVIIQSAEEAAAYIIQLTHDQAVAVNYALNSKNYIEMHGGGWCGSCSIHGPFKTIERAREFLESYI